MKGERFLFVCSHCELRVWPHEYGEDFDEDAHEGRCVVLCGVCREGTLIATPVNSCPSIKAAHIAAVGRIEDSDEFLLN